MTPKPGGSGDRAPAPARRSPMSLSEGAPASVVKSDDPPFCMCRTPRAKCRSNLLPTTHRGWGMDDGATALTDSDRELAERAAGGNTHAFEELYRRHVQSAWRVAQAVTGNRDDAADATSEAFVRVLRALQAGRIAPADHFRPYLMAAARSS